MTVAVSLKVSDGVVLASDSASTLSIQPKATPATHIVYNNANKILNLIKGSPIGVITWGCGNIGQASTATLLKDFRRRITVDQPGLVDRQDYQLGGVATLLKEFIYDQTYTAAFAQMPEKPVLGFMVAGYSTGEALAEAWQINIADGDCKGPFPVHPNQSGWSVSGEPEAIQRLILGFGTGLGGVLSSCGIGSEKIAEVVGACQERLKTDLVFDSMPIQDAVDLAAFLVQTTISYSRFTLGPQTVGGPIEVAAITKHEGFKWIRRKHYFEASLNPEEGHAQ